MKKITLIYLLIFPSVFLFSKAWAQSEEVATKSGKLSIHPIIHSSMVLEWNGKTIYIDPYGGADKYANHPPADLVLITDIHGDHMNAKTLEGLDLSGAELIVPKAVQEQLPELKFKKIHSLDNDQSLSWGEIKVKAIPMYNLPENEESRHPKGRGNGYVLSMGGKNIYISGDTEDIAEMRNLKKIDIAFICMNLPYTMDVNQAADAVLDFKPKLVYPFHYRGGGGKFSDVEKFKSLVQQKNSKIKVKLLNWYP